VLAAAGKGGEQEKEKKEKNLSILITKNIFIPFFTFSRYIFIILIITCHRRAIVVHRSSHRHQPLPIDTCHCVENSRTA